MFFIVVKFETRPDWTRRWPGLSSGSPLPPGPNPATGNLWFDWARSLEYPAMYVLVAAFRDDEAGAARVNNEHVKQALREMPRALASTPKILTQTVDATGWSEMAELKIN
ncbi:MAG: antibiotic biosynthesis monooxygenase [Mycobacterium sp.]|nr:antibiotic biosynthesis monooxygenase [Mycobacterium sp.]